MATTSFGGRYQSEDPYSVHVDYLKYLFGVGPTYPAPRFESHYMYQMTSRM